MNPEIDQQQKFIEQFIKLLEDAPRKFRDLWDGEVKFIQTGRARTIPSVNSNLISLLPDAHRNKFEILRKKFYAKAL